jgi:uncharacterized membrane protein (UPF0127 family)
MSLDTRVADTHLGRLRGLIGRRRLGPSEGLWLAPCQGIHTIGLFFPIDVVYLGLGGEVVHLMENVSPFRITPLRRSAHSVLELPVRTIHESQTRVGDQLVVCSAESLEGASSTKDWLNQVAERQLEEGVEEPATAMRWRTPRTEGNQAR